MKKNIIYLATHNEHKVHEIAAMLKNTSYEIASLNQVDYSVDIEENGSTLEENAFIKASAMFEFLQTACCGEDSGLEVFALDGAPGVWSARYAGPDKNPANNIKKLLQNLKNISDRRARFRTVICYTDGNNTWYFEGIIAGTISVELKGTGGFGYDPVFIPEGYDITFAEMPAEEKNKISHRAIAVEKFTDFLKKRNQV